MSGQGPPSAGILGAEVCESARPRDSCAASGQSAVMNRRFGSLASFVFALSVLAPACGTAVSPRNDAATSDAGGALDTGSTPPDTGTAADAAPGTDGGALGDGGTGECARPSDCALRARSCCGHCGVPSSSDLIALPTTSLDAYATRVCAGVACPECAAMPDPSLFATCSAGACAPVDLHGDPLAVCTQDTDCVLAVPQCCACGAIGLDQAVAYNPAHGSLAALVCDPGVDCPPCVPDFGALRAICDGGHCAVRPSR